MPKNIQMNILQDNGTYDVLYPQTLGNLVSGAVESAKKATQADSATNASNATNATTSGTCTGNAATATKLATARNIRTNLSSTNYGSFDGSGDVTPGISGTLSVSYGGTGVNSYSSLASQISPYISAGTKLVISSYVGNGADDRTLMSYREYGNLQAFEILCNTGLGTTKCFTSCGFIPVAFIDNSLSDARTIGFNNAETSTLVVSYNSYLVYNSYRGLQVDAGEFNVNGKTYYLLTLWN